MPVSAEKELSPLSRIYEAFPPVNYPVSWLIIVIGLVQMIKEAPLAFFCQRRWCVIGPIIPSVRGITFDWTMMVQMPLIHAAGG
jgi:hypothetical protein